MIFSRDAVQSKMQSLNESAAERARVLLYAAYAMCMLSVILFISVLFTSNHWGGAVTFQALSTSILTFCLGGIIVTWILSQSRHQMMNAIGGAYLVNLLMLLQTALLWGNLSSGIGGNRGSICFIYGNRGDHAVSVISYLLFFLNLFVALAAFRWRSDWTESGALSSYSTIQQSNSGKPVKDKPTVQSFDDAETGL